MRSLFAMQAMPINQRGMTLIVGLVMLLLLTIIGLAAIRGASLEERMAGNYRDRALAFQSAEAALRAAEAVMNGVPPNMSGTEKGYGPQVARGGSPEYWSSTGSGSFDWSARALQTSLGLQNVYAQPLYFVEKISSAFAEEVGSAVDEASEREMDQQDVRYRITAKATGGSSDTVVILQSTYH